MNSFPDSSPPCDGDCDMENFQQIGRTDLRILSHGPPSKKFIRIFKSFFGSAIDRHCSPSTAASPSPGAIEPGVIDTLDEIKRRSKRGEWALRTARRNGLRVIYTGGRGVAKGGDFIACFESIASQPATTAKP